MYFSHYEYFLKIAEEKSISKAAESLCVSQPAISKYVKRLEDYIGVPLIDHRSSPVQLTKMGRIYLKYATEISHLEQKFNEEIAQELNIGKRNIVIGTSQWRSSFVLPKLLPLLNQRYPFINTVVRIDKTRKIMDEMFKDNIDFCILNLYSLQNYENIVWEKISDERILLAVNRENPIVKDSIKLDGPFNFDLKKRIIPHIKLERLRENAICLARYSKNISSIVEKLFSENSLVPAEMRNLENVVTALYYVSSNQGISFIPESGIYENFIPDNVALFTIGEPVLTWPLIIARKATSQPTETSRILLNLLHEIYKFT